MHNYQKNNEIDELKAELKEYHARIYESSTIKQKLEGSFGDITMEEKLPGARNNESIENEENNELLALIPDKNTEKIEEFQRKFDETTKEIEDLNYIIKEQTLSAELKDVELMELNKTIEILNKEIISKSNEIKLLKNEFKGLDTLNKEKFKEIDSIKAIFSDKELNLKKIISSLESVNKEKSKEIELLQISINNHKEELSKKEQIIKEKLEIIGSDVLRNDILTKELLNKSEIIKKLSNELENIQDNIKHSSVIIEKNLEIQVLQAEIRIYKSHKNSITGGLHILTDFYMKELDNFKRSHMEKLEKLQMKIINIQKILPLMNFIKNFYNKEKPDNLSKFLLASLLKNNQMMEFAKKTIEKPNIFSSSFDKTVKKTSISSSLQGSFENEFILKRFENLLKGKSQENTAIWEDIINKQWKTVFQGIELWGDLLRNYSNLVVKNETGKQIQMKIKGIYQDFAGFLGVKNESAVRECEANEGLEVGLIGVMKFSEEFNEGIFQRKGYCISYFM